MPSGNEPWFVLMLIQGWGLLSQFPPFRYFPNFSALSKQTLAIEYHVYIWQVSSQLSCGDICQILMWFEKSYMYFCHIENFAYGKNNERSFSNPRPWSMSPYGLTGSQWDKIWNVYKFSVEYYSMDLVYHSELIWIIASFRISDKPLSKPKG